MSELERRRLTESIRVGHGEEALRNEKVPRSALGFGVDLMRPTSSRRVLKAAQALLRLSAPRAREFDHLLAKTSDGGQSVSPELADDYTTSQMAAMSIQLTKLSFLSVPTLFGVLQTSRDAVSSHLRFSARFCNPARTGAR